jgi:hypothetical protein
MQRGFQVVALDDVTARAPGELQIVQHPGILSRAIASRLTPPRLHA